MRLELFVGLKESFDIERVNIVDIVTYGIQQIGANAHSVGCR